MSENALVIFEERGVPANVQSAVLEFDPDFESRSVEDQVALIEYVAKSAEATVEGARISFPQVKTLHAGAAMFKLPPEAGEEDGAGVKSFDAVVLDTHLANGYWPKSVEDGGDSKPECASLDGKVPYTDVKHSPSNIQTLGGVDIEKGGCAVCPFNQFGSGKNGRGKACKNQRRFILALDGHGLPARMSLSAANFKQYNQLASTLADTNTPIGNVKITFSAVAEKNDDGIEFTGIAMRPAGKLTPIDILDLDKRFMKPFSEDFRFQPFEQDSTPSGPPPQETSGEKAQDLM